MWHLGTPKNDFLGLNLRVILGGVLAAWAFYSVPWAPFPSPWEGWGYQHKNSFPMIFEARGTTLEPGDGLFDRVKAFPKNNGPQHAAEAIELRSHALEWTASRFWFLGLFGTWDTPFILYSIMQYAVPRSIHSVQNPVA